jgi:hypothetical protein
MKHQWIGRVLGLSAVSLAACGSGTRADLRATEASSGGQGGNALGGGALGGSAQAATGGMLVLGGNLATPAGGADTDGDTCVAVTEEAELKAAIDIIFVIDNSQSMEEEIDAVEKRINADFASIIAASGVDYRVIMLSELRSNQPLGYLYGICVGPPLGGHVCEGTNADAVNAERYFPYQSVNFDIDSWCRMLDTFTRPDPVPFSLCPPADVFPPGFAPRGPIAANGWQTHLRPNVFKSFVTITDDDVSCRQATPEMCAGGDADESLWDGFEREPSPKSPEDKAAAFDRRLQALSAVHFGTPQRRNYRYHSITGIEADGVVAPSEPLIDENCSDTWNSGKSYQALSRLTGGLRFSICQNQNFDAIFQQLAADAIETAQLNCDWPIPAAPASETFDPAKVNVQYRPGGGSSATTISAVGSAADCGTESGWYYDDNASPQRIFVCPTTCDALRSDRDGKVDIAFGCNTRTRIPA